MSNTENLHQYTLKGYFEQLKSEIESSQTNKQDSILARVTKSLDQLIPTTEGETQRKLMELRAEVEDYLQNRPFPKVEAMKPMKKASLPKSKKKTGTP